MNDEGTECGGLGFAGWRGPEGKEQAGYLTFDYEQNESFRFGQNQIGDVATNFLEFSDQPAWSLVDMIEEAEGLDGAAAQAVYDRYLGDVGGLGRSRLRLAREEDGSARLVLRDGEGRDRLRLVVPADGQPAVEVVATDGTTRLLLD